MENNVHGHVLTYIIDFVLSKVVFLVRHDC